MLGIGIFYFSIHKLAAQCWPHDQAAAQSSHQQEKEYTTNLTIITDTHRQQLIMAPYHHPGFHSIKILCTHSRGIQDEAGFLQTESSR